MERYSVTVVSPGAGGQRPTLLVPFQPNSVVIEFINELWKRVSKQNLSLAANTHIATLHIDSETGAVIDCEDVLGDVVNAKDEKIFAVFAPKPSPAPKEDVTHSNASVTGQPEGETLSVRIITPELASNKAACSVLQIPVGTTIHQLHDRIAQHLHIQPIFDDDADVLECNCDLAKQLANEPCGHSECFVVHGKSIVERLPLRSPTEAALKEALRSKFGVDVEAKKKIELRGAEINVHDATTYKKPPVVAVCSKQRHVPKHARVEEVDESGQRKFKFLDLHTSEQPIHPACMNASVAEAGLAALANDGITDIYTVNRTATGHNQAAMVFVSLVQDMKKEERSQDAVLHVFDLLTNAFAPALRALQILIQGKTPTPVESAALSHAVFVVLDSFMPTEIIGTDRSRLFEGSRLLFGFILEKARALRLSEEEGLQFPYNAAFHTVDLRDHSSHEAVMHAVRTTKGLMEASLFNAFQEGGLLCESQLQGFHVKSEIEQAVIRQALLSGGSVAELTVFSMAHLKGNYRYADAGNVDAAIDPAELSEMEHLAELCGRNKLAVHKPSQLASAVAPCLTFDRNAHLAVYTGEQPCSDPGKSSMVFRPLHGEDVIDASVVEQLIAPILRGYEADGSAVLCMYGGAAVRRLQTPDEILMFAVDTSASMRKPTDFDDITDEPLDEAPVSTVSLIEPEFYNKASFDDMKEHLRSYEGFTDMIAIVGNASQFYRRSIARRVLGIWKMMLYSQIKEKSSKVDVGRGIPQAQIYRQRQMAALLTALSELKTIWAGLTTHEQALIDFLIYRSQSTSYDISEHWKWSIGDAVPASSPAQYIPQLDASITEIPHHLRCPISHTLMLDAVDAIDGFTYSRTAIVKWFAIRQSSPMTGLPLSSIALTSNTDKSNAAADWVDGEGLPGRDGGEAKRPRTSFDVKIVFDSKDGSFQRQVPSSIGVHDLYRLVFRALKGRYPTFQLVTEHHGPVAATRVANLSVLGIKDGDHITIRIAEDNPVPRDASGPGARQSDLALIKVYGAMDQMYFAYWVKKDTSNTLASILWKYWRHRLYSDAFIEVEELEVWTDMTHSGDGLLAGWPGVTTDQLPSLLNPQHCFGILGAEKVYREENRNAGIDAPLVLKVQIHRQRSEEPDHKLSRLDVLKQMFEALANRVLAYNYKTHIGLVTFNSTPQVAMGISHVLENFRRATNDMRASGDTSLWDALSLSMDQLIEYGKKYPHAAKRIICISDGVDTKSLTNTGPDVCWNLRNAGIVVDSVSIGHEDNLDLHALSAVLGAYHFHPTSLVNALAICEMEPFLSLSERPQIVPRVGTSRTRPQLTSYFRSMKSFTEPTVVNEYSVPPRKQHPNMDDSFVELAAIVKARSNTASTSSSAPTSNLRSSRLLNEMRQLANREHRTYDVYVSERDMSFFKVAMAGPEGSPYEAGTFLLYLHADDGYPIFAPKARFITKMMHPNVNMHGRICHRIFDRDWTSDVSISSLLDTVYGLLLQPEHSDPVNTTTTLGYHHDPVDFAEEVRDHVNRHASQSREAWRAEILGEIDEDEEEGDEDMDDVD